MYIVVYCIYVGGFVKYYNLDCLHACSVIFAFLGCSGAPYLLGPINYAGRVAV